jgi:hypothetical protein
MIAVVSYNPLPLCRELALTEPRVWCFDQMFNPKGVASVHRNDLVYRRLVSNILHYEKIIIFCGKKSSGSCSIIPHFLGDSRINRDTLFFVLCSHDLAEKEDILRYHGVPKNQWMYFHDHEYVNDNPCDEDPILCGYVKKYL